VYPFLFSYVADHFQYLASLGPFMLVAGAGVALGRGVWTSPPARARAGAVVTAGTLAVLGTLTWSRAEVFHEEETLWRNTLAENPEAWLAHNNLGVILVKRGDHEGALFHYGRAIETAPGDEVVRVNLATSPEEAEIAAAIRERLSLYEARQPYHRAQQGRGEEEGRQEHRSEFPRGG
jgi:hypothetical protein